MKELEKATDHFNKHRILGRGGQGTVYKGILLDGSIVAIKKAQVIDERETERHGNENLKKEHFINEIIILSQINHRNIVKLLGCCLDAELPLLVYEFIPNGTLHQYLHEPDKEFQLPWEIRLHIAIEVAGALSYLHSAAPTPIYHRDIKSTNILLDENYHAKTADFGISRTICLDQTHVTTVVQGTFGYLDPEFFQTHRFTDRSDVYSFGFVLVELLTGERPISSTRTGECKGLAAYFILSLEDDRLFEILDEKVLQCGRKEEIIFVCGLAKRCLIANGRRRPTMREVARELERINSLNLSDSMQQSQENGELIAYFDGLSTSTEFETWDAASLT